ncbi:peptide ABC transporter substrate-binding protein [Microbacterium sp. APC 3898]|uniref:Peptide ABC transporter substrate-binding protein n=2 Tax=Planococcus TaxID=1372 RepID=A0ABT7ZLI0_9BACL|nr:MULTISPECIES: peptide ABC transporter substrate-binding protein [Terrabacteria group]MBD8014935.1 peptide ABC transporter substrate-binding protein [Planococcus wigleyi]MDN3427922.1 peptide ABC transporter substrate-binding protein [Planococcus sp. APC 4016]MDN3439125.1 peptide ABC transporter substrate-binding protein [Planococcus sp. APC 3900]MDN3498543.1 peptide ABC transporter substrate-binding protein [Microbacterium sp. APC 3898]
MERKRKTQIFMILIAFVLILSGCNFNSSESSNEESAAEGEAGQVLNISTTADIPTLDSTKAHDGIAFTVLNNVNEGLYRQDENHEPIEALVTDHTENEDKSVHTFTLRDSNWSNGEPVTAQDFEYAWKRVMKDASPYNFMFVTAGIKNAEAIMNEEMDAEELGVKAIDEKTLEVTLEAANPLFQSLMTFPTFLPQNQKFVEEQGDQYALEAENILFNGPFTLVDWTHEQGWKYEKNEDYWDADTVKLDAVNAYVVKDPAAGVNLYETNKVDRIVLSSEAVDQNKDDENFDTILEPEVIFLRFNHNHPVLGNKNIRQAVNMAIDKASLTDVILKNGSTALNGIVPKGFFKSPTGEDFRDLNGDFNTGTVEEAQKLWETGLKETGATDVTVSINIADSEDHKKVAEYIQAQLEDNLPGFKLDIKAVPFAQRLEIEKAVEYDLSLSSWGPDYSDPMTYLDMWLEGGSANRMDYKNAELEELVASARTETDLEKRYQMLLDIEKILLEEDAAIVPLYQEGAAVLMRSKIKNLLVHPTGASFSYKWVTIEE